MMSPEAWQAVGVIAAAAIATTGTVITTILVGRSRKDVQRGATAAEDARDNTDHIKNGFASHVTEALVEVAQRGRDNEQALEWITAALGKHLASHRKHDWRTPTDPATPSWDTRDEQEDEGREGP